MYVNHDDLQAIAGPGAQGDSILSAMDDEVVSLTCKVCAILPNSYILFCFVFVFEL